MNILYLLVPVALMLGGGFIAAFLWATKNDQFEDVNTPAVRMLIDDDEPQNHQGE